MELINKEKLIPHPLEEILEIESGTTLVEYTEVIPSPVTPAPSYDNKDMEIETQLEEIYSLAMGQVTSIGDQIELVEGKYKARIGEVTANMLNVALGAVREKRELKRHKDDLTADQQSGGPRTVNNNLVVTDRNEILKLLQGKK